MPDSPVGSTDPQSERLKSTNTLMALVILLLLGQVAWQQMRIGSLRADVDQAKRDLATKVEKMANERVQMHREDVVNAVAFLDDLYRSDAGLQRPGGLFNPESHRVDAEAIGTWVLDVYMQARMAGKSDADARQAISGAIKGSDEWHRKHPKG